ncbi:MAG: chorismate synthase [Tidjanibacter sp.]|nr:chorismate synthase [Tidjanibacter sp.]
MNTFGHNFRISLFGESHGPAVGVVIDGIPAGLALGVEEFAHDLERRKGGQMGTTERREADTPEILSGLYEGHTTGAPMAIIFRNENVRSEDYASLSATPRPGHADWVATQKFAGYNDPRGGGHFSGRLTLPLVAAGVVAKKILGDVVIKAQVEEIGGERDSAKWEALLSAAKAEGDSLGAIVGCRVEGAGVGLGEPFFDSVESAVSHLLFAIPGVRGVEFGDGFAATLKRGSEHNDPIVAPDGTTSRNGAGGINGGITNGNPITLRVAFKPTSSIAREQQTLNTSTGQVEALTIGGRHDVCIALRGAVVVEAAVAIALASLK